MRFEIVISKKDKAGMNIAGNLDKLGIEYFLIESESIYSEEEIRRLNLDCDFVIFATKHRSEKGKKSLTCHAPGNWQGADFGGKEGKVCRTSGTILKRIFNELSENLPEGWRATLECTHHGPLIEKPCCFIEIGSTEEDWEDGKAGKIIANVLKKVLNNIIFEKNKYKSAIGIGGPHYCPNFNKIQLGDEYAIGHVIPQYVFPVTKEMIEKAVAGTLEKVEKAVIDWKGCGASEDREKLINLIKGCGLEVVRSDKVGK